MNIRTEQDITSATALELRKLSGLTQTEFWEGVGSNQGSGHLFENGKRKGIPKPIRMLIFLRYVAKVPVYVSEPAEADLVCKIGAQMAVDFEAIEAAKLAAEADARLRKLEKERRKSANALEKAWRTADL